MQVIKSQSSAHLPPRSHLINWFQKSTKVFDLFNTSVAFPAETGEKLQIEGKLH